MAARWVVLPASYSMLFSFLEVRTHPEAKQVNEASTVLPVVKCRILRMFVCSSSASGLGFHSAQLRGRDLR